MYNNTIKLQTSIDFQKALPKEICILCHGYMGSIEKPPLDEMYNMLSKQMPCVTFNFVGKEIGFPTYTECVTDLFEVITYLSSIGVREINLVGHSMGAAVCLLMTNRLKATKIVKKLILVSMPYSILTFKERYHVGEFKEDEQYKYIRVGDKKVRVLREFINDLYKYSLEKELKKLSIPVLILMGGKDGIIKKSDAYNIYKDIFSEEFKQLKRRKSIKIIPGAGHLYRGQKNIKAACIEIESFLLKQYAN